MQNILSNRKNTIIQWLCILLFLCVGNEFLCAQVEQHDSLNPHILQGITIATERPTGETGFAVSNVNFSNIQSNIGNGSVNNMFDLVPAMVTTSDA